MQVWEITGEDVSRNQSKPTISADRCNLGRLLLLAKDGMRP